MDNLSLSVRLTKKKLFYWTVFWMTVLMLLFMHYDAGLWNTKFSNTGADVHVMMNDDLSAAKAERLLNTSAGDNVMINYDLSTIKSGTLLNTDAVDLAMLHAYKLQDDFFPSWFWNVSLRELSKRLYAKKRHGNVRLPFTSKISSLTEQRNWVKFQRHIRRYSLYDPEDPAVEGVLRDMAAMSIVEIDENHRGTQLKVNVKLEDGGWAILKPSRHGDAYDRPFAEIAAFHLDRVLGYNRVPPTVGRRVNIMSELAPLFPPDFHKTIFKSEDGRSCFIGKCKTACHAADPVCGTPDSVNVSMMYLLQRQQEIRFKTIRNPWAYWKYYDVAPAEEKLCRQTKARYESGNPLYLDILDMVYFDLLIDNWDRHRFAVYNYFAGQSNTILFDNGKGFPNASADGELHSFLYDRGGCCLIKKSTFLKFSKLYWGPEKLSGLMRTSLKTDPLAPVLSEDHIISLDRRIDKIMLYIKDCLKDRAINDVIIADISVS